MFFEIQLLISLIFILFSVMFITLVERKLLSYSQMRIGPNKIFFSGFLQPLLDGGKLLLKETLLIKSTNKIFFSFTPFLFLMIMFFLWMMIFISFSLFNIKFSILFIFCCVGLTVFINLLSGWSSNSKYSMFGALRSSAQTISYEILLTFCFFSSFFFFLSFSILSIKKMFFFYFFMLWPWSFFWIVCLLSECNRAPMDFAEGESELVSGFNTEYSSGDFAILFVGEYGMIIFFSLLFILSFFSIFFLIFSTIFISFFLLIRSCYPRYRYDKFMNFTWEKLLPVMIMLFSFNLFLMNF